MWPCTLLVPSPRSKAGWVRLTPACTGPKSGLGLTLGGAGDPYVLQGQRQPGENRSYLQCLTNFKSFCLWPEQRWLGTVPWSEGPGCRHHVYLW